MEAMGGPTTGIVYDPIAKTHRTGLWHPESPERCDAVMGALTAPALRERTVDVPSRAATESEILLCHTPAYLERARRDIASGAPMLSTGDTNICRESWTAALWAAGSVLSAVDAVIDGRVANAFCVVRPPGHHAGPARGMGFCVFNNVAIGARYAQKSRGVGKVLIADWDVHHGNGAQDAFYEDGSVFYFSTHQFPFYPGAGASDETGSGPGRGTTMNCPFPAGTGGEDVVGAFRDRLLPAASRFKPDLVMVSAGFDARLGDPIGGFRLTDDDFAELTSIVLEIARDHAEGRLVSVLEGGYALDGLAAATAAHVGRLTATQPPPRRSRLGNEPRD
ncbi:MAG TPA: histone deacetylase [Sumerlaeia bacterium]|nr:histone deacetylase [Sumerlaeia bacterium]